MVWMGWYVRVGTDTASYMRDCGDLSRTTRCLAELSLKSSVIL